MSNPLVSLAALALVPLLACAAEAADPIPADGQAPVKTSSGLTYSVLTPGGPGKSPKMGDSVTVHYTGWLTDGKVFDSSRTDGKASTFKVGEVIPGWNEALGLMTPGARWKLTIPPALGYGARGYPPDIPGDATLIFDVELLSVKSKPVFYAGDPAKQAKTPSGLVVEVLEAGQGDGPTPADNVELAYTLWTTSGTLLDTSEFELRRGPPPRPLKGRAGELPLPMLKEAVQMMRKGGRIWVKVPPELAFGAQAQGPELPANSWTIWELGLRNILAPLPCPPFALSAPGAAKKLPSGLQIEMLAEGTGTSPKLGDTVTVHYAGWLTNGSLFDSSFGRGEPMSFQLGRVIQGWNEGLALMKPGGKARLTIPGPLAYGESGSGDKIGPNATLVFYVELIKVGG